VAFGVTTGVERLLFSVVGEVVFCASVDVGIH
jgi:hypothetical protein